MKRANQQVMLSSCAAVGLEANSSKISGSPTAWLNKICTKNKMFWCRIYPENPLFFFFVFFIDIFKITDQETTPVFIHSSVRVKKRERGPWDGHVTPTEQAKSILQHDIPVIDGQRWGLAGPDRRGSGGQAILRPCGVFVFNLRGVA